MGSPHGTGGIQRAGIIFHGGQFTDDFVGWCTGNGAQRQGLIARVGSRLFKIAKQETAFCVGNRLNAERDIGNGTIGEKSIGRGAQGVHVQVVGRVPKIQI